jgi:hypothetical protein
MFHSARAVLDGRTGPYWRVQNDDTRRGGSNSRTGYYCPFPQVPQNPRSQIAVYPFYGNLNLMGFDYQHNYVSRWLNELYMHGYLGASGMSGLFNAPNYNAGRHNQLTLNTWSHSGSHGLRDYDALRQTTGQPRLNDIQRWPYETNFVFDELEANGSPGRMWYDIPFPESPP